MSAVMETVAVAGQRDQQDPSALAMQLLGKWSRVSQGHVAFSMTCGCAPGFEGVAAMEFEEMIIDFIVNRHRAGFDAIPELGQLVAKPGELGLLAQLLTLMARQRFAPDIVRPMLADLKNSIDSFDSLHGGPTS
jgi:hypothetical protein